MTSKASRAGPLGLGLGIWNVFNGPVGSLAGNFIITEGSDPIITESGNNWIIE